MAPMGSQGPSWDRWGCIVTPRQLPNIPDSRSQGTWSPGAQVWPGHASFFRKGSPGDSDELLGAASNAPQASISQLELEKGVVPESLLRRRGGLGAFDALG